MIYGHNLQGVFRLTQGNAYGGGSHEAYSRTSSIGPAVQANDITVDIKEASTMNDPRATFDNRHPILGVSFWV